MQSAASDASHINEVDKNILDMTTHPLPAPACARKIVKLTTNQSFLRNIFSESISH